MPACVYAPTFPIIYTYTLNYIYIYISNYITYFYINIHICFCLYIFLSITYIHLNFLLYMYMFLRSMICVLIELLRGSAEKIRFSLTWWAFRRFQKVPLPMEYILSYTCLHNMSFNREQCLQFYKTICLQ